MEDTFDQKDFSREQIEELADAELNNHRNKTDGQEPFSFQVKLGEKSYEVFYEKDDLGSWKLQDFKEI